MYVEFPNRICIIIAAVLFSFIFHQGSFGLTTLGADTGAVYTHEESPLENSGVFQPYINFRSDYFFSEIWASYNTGDKPDEYRECTVEVAAVDESDYYFLKTGLISYSFNDAVPSTQEVFVDILAGAATGPYLTGGFYFDIDEFLDYYANAGAGYYLQAGSSAGLRVEITMGIAGGVYSADSRGGLYDMVAELSFEYFWAGGLAATVTIKYVDTLDEDVYPFPDIQSYILAGIAYSF